MKRCQVKPLSTSAEIHAVLSALKIGERVPPEVYIADYQDGGSMRVRLRIR